MFLHSSKPAQRSSFWIAAAIGSLLSAQGFLGLASRPITTNQISQVRSPEIEAPEFADRSNAAIALSAIGVGIIGFSWARAQSSKSTTKSNRTKTDRQLLLLLHQDAAAAERLVDQMQRKHPERSREWCVEKVKYDLQRDRH